MLLLIYIYCSPIKAIGECGLDYSNHFPDKEHQQRWFEIQVELAVKHKIPLFLHERFAFEEFIKVLQPYHDNNTLPNCIVHCFTGNTMYAPHTVV